MRDELQAVVDRSVAEHDEMPGRLLHALGPDLDVEVAAGVADRATGTPLEPGMQFRIASVTKPFVAAAALRLAEDGALDLDAPIAPAVSEETNDLLIQGGYDPDAITPRHLLTHTSGIYDFAADAYDDTVTDGFLTACMADPTHRWTRLEQLRFAIDHGKPYGPPGSVYCYSDTGANVVGEILERLTGTSMGAAVRSLVAYERLGLTRTFHESVEDEPAGVPPTAHQYEGDFDVWRYDPSVDLWGGGGLVSTCGDLGRFFRALVRGDVFHRPETLATMCTLPQAPSFDPEPQALREAASTGMFLVRREIGGHVFWGHGGYWGTAVLSSAELDLTVVSQDGQAFMPRGYSKYAIVGDVLEVLGLS